jgi:membrane protein DedA with SNARE-associated domain
VQRVDRLLLRYHSGLIIGLRFLYGLRLIGPLAIGMSTVRTARFVAFNLIGAALWAPLVSGAGYLFGHTLVTLFADARHIEEIALLALLAGAAALGLWHRRYWRR